MNRVPFDPVRFEDSAISAAAEVHDGFRADVISGLSQVQKTLPCKYLYDEHGAQLFDAICSTPEYYPTRTEIAILRRHAGDISALAGSGVHLIELGSGACVKTRIVLDALASPRSYVPVDIAADGLFSEASLLQRDYPRLAVRPVYADFTRPFAIPAACAMGRKVGFFPGSTIGNFTPEEAARFLRRTAELLGRDGLLIIGVDLKKARRLLEDAYNDAGGVTASFNLNILRRINANCMPTSISLHSRTAPPTSRRAGASRCTFTASPSSRCASTGGCFLSRPANRSIPRIPTSTRWPNSRLWPSKAGSRPFAFGRTRPGCSASIAWAFLQPPEIPT